MRIWHQGFLDLGTAPGYREALERHAAAVAQPGTTVAIHGMPAGAFEGTSPAEVARHVYLSGLYANDVIDGIREAEAEGFDAAICGTLQDVGLDESRSLVSIPVLGYGATAMHLACLLGQRFAILAFNPDLFPLVEERVRKAGLQDRLSQLALIDTDYAAVEQGFVQPEPVIAAFDAAARRAAEAGASVIIPGQMVLSEVLFANRFARVDEVPVIDGFGACIAMAETLVQLRDVSGVDRPRTGFWDRPPPPDVVAKARARYLAGPSLPG